MVDNSDDPSARTGGTRTITIAAVLAAVLGLTVALGLVLGTDPGTDNASVTPMGSDADEAPVAGSDQGVSDDPREFAPPWPARRVGGNCSAGGIVAHWRVVDDGAWQCTATTPDAQPPAPPPEPAPAPEPAPPVEAAPPPPAYEPPAYVPPPPPVYEPPAYQPPVYEPPPPPAPPPVVEPEPQPLPEPIVEPEPPPPVPEPAPVEQERVQRDAPSPDVAKVAKEQDEKRKQPEQVDLDAQKQKALAEIRRQRELAAKERTQAEMRAQQLADARASQTDAASPASPPRGNPNSRSSNQAAYIVALQDAILRQWTRPESVKLDDVCQVLIRQIPGGEVV